MGRTAGNEHPPQSLPPRRPNPHLTRSRPSDKNPKLSKITSTPAVQITAKQLMSNLFPAHMQARTALPSLPTCNANECGPRLRLWKGRNQALSQKSRCCIERLLFACYATRNFGSYLFPSLSLSGPVDHRLNVHGLHVRGSVSRSSTKRYPFSAQPLKPTHPLLPDHPSRSHPSAASFLLTFAYADPCQVA